MLVELGAGPARAEGADPTISTKVKDTANIERLFIKPTDQRSLGSAMLVTDSAWLDQYDVQVGGRHTPIA